MLHLDAIPLPVRRLLNQLSPRRELMDFMLGGGTSLALRFGHRVSVDLDWITTRAFDPGGLLADLGLEGATEVARAVNTLTLDAAGVKLDFLRHAYPLLGMPEEIGGVRLLSIPDVAAMKLNAIANRGAKKDFFDLGTLLRHHSLETMLGWFESKYRYTDRFTVIRSMAWFEDAENEPDPVSLVDATWDGTKTRIGSELAMLR